MTSLFITFKKLVEPLQLWLLGQNRCVGCGKELDKFPHKKLKKGEELVKCDCGRSYVVTMKTHAYRRALLSETK